MTREEREEIAKKRLISILRVHGVATARTLEQKISDAGPNNQRVDPHILTPSRNELIKAGRIVRTFYDNIPWFHLHETDQKLIESRIKHQLPVYQQLSGNVSRRTGQALEIATYRALLTLPNLEFQGRFRGLNEHDDSTLYAKEEPLQHIGGRELSGQQRLDFIVRHATAGNLGVECKNVREWLYPDRGEVTELLLKCVTLDCIPVLIARRIPFVTFKLLTTCGAIVHQTYNQLLAQADKDLAAQAADKNCLGYHDIRTGNEPDARLIKFIGTNLLAVATAARPKFDEYKDLLESFARGGMDYEEFAARVRRRSAGDYEEGDWNPDGPKPWQQ